MMKKLICLLAAVNAIGAMALAAPEVATGTGEGTFLLQKNSYPLKHALAYEAVIEDEDGIVVVVSGQAVSGETLKEVQDAEKEGYEGNFKRPFIQLLFKKTAEHQT